MILCDELASNESTQHLYLLGLRFDIVQLRGRWSSLAVQRYLQQARPPWREPSRLVPPRKCPILQFARGLISGPIQYRCRRCRRRVGRHLRLSLACQTRPRLSKMRCACSSLGTRTEVDGSLAVNTWAVNTWTRRAHKPDDNEGRVRSELWATTHG